MKGQFLDLRVSTPYYALRDTLEPTKQKCNAPLFAVFQSASEGLKDTAPQLYFVLGGRI